MSYRYRLVPCRQCGAPTEAYRARKYCPDCRLRRHDEYHAQPHVRERKRAYARAYARAHADRIAARRREHGKLLAYIQDEARARGVSRALVRAELYRRSGNQSLGR